MAPFFKKKADVRPPRRDGDAPRGARDHDRPAPRQDGPRGYDGPRGSRPDGPRRDKFNDGSRARYEGARANDRDDRPRASFDDPRSNDRSGPRSNDRSDPRSNDRSGPRSNDRSAPRSSDRAGPRSTDRPAPRSGDRAGPRSNDRSGPRSNDRPAARGNDRAVPQGSGRFGGNDRAERDRAPKPRREEEEIERPEGLSASGEMKYHGFNACEALWKNRAIDIIRVYVSEERLADFGPLLKWCAHQKKAYHVCAPHDLEKIAATVHHEGVVILAHAPKPLGDDDLDSRIANLSGATPLIYLDGVQNPHNVGSITRLAAHFGVPMIMGKDKELPRLSPSAARVAEGAAEHVPLMVLKDPDLAFSKLKKKGYKIIVTSSHAPTSLYQGALPSKVLLVFGGESAGASPRVTKLADLQVNIPGTGTVESLNVAVAAGLFLGEFWRAHKV